MRATKRNQKAPPKLHAPGPFPSLTPKHHGPSTKHLATDPASIKHCAVGASYPPSCLTKHLAVHLLLLGLCSLDALLCLLQQLLHRLVSRIDLQAPLTVRDGQLKLLELHPRLGPPEQSLGIAVVKLQRRRAVVGSLVPDLHLEEALSKVAVASDLECLGLRVVLLLHRRLHVDKLGKVPQRLDVPLRSKLLVAVLEQLVALALVLFSHRVPLGKL
mmetsp:Transcript_17906/g.45199  ORF Transcript_17906/g.45199 Transcript_17906/m.45199 type:complete len:216 (-) Transcript_17906:441-1088(-)